MSKEVCVMVRKVWGRQMAAKPLSVRDAVANAHQIKSRAEVCNRERNHFLNQVSVVYP